MGDLTDLYRSVEQQWIGAIFLKKLQNFNLSVNISVSIQYDIVDCYMCLYKHIYCVYFITPKLDLLY